MASVDARSIPPLEFVHTTSAADVIDTEWLAVGGHPPIADLEPLMSGGPTAGRAPDHVFVLRQGDTVATLRAGEALRSRFALPVDVRPPATDVVFYRLVAPHRTGPGCSHRLQLLLWAAQWLTTHAGVRTVGGICRADALHRYAPLGFRQTSRWFAAGFTRHAVVVVQADARDIVCTGRSLGLHHILDCALTAVGGRSTLAGLRTVAA